MAIWNKKKNYQVHEPDNESKPDSAIIQRMANDRENTNRTRNDTYKKLLWAYHGEYDKLLSHDTGGESQGYDVSERSVVKPAVVCNFLNTIVNQNMAKRGMLPEVKVMVPYPGGDEQKKKSEKQERILLSYWENSLMVEKMAEIAFDCSVFGTSILQGYPDFKAKIPAIAVRDPATCYPQRAFGSSWHNLSDCIFKWKESTERINKMFLNKLKSGSVEENVNCVEYFNRWWRILYINGVEMAAIKHDYNIVPIVIVPNLPIPRRAYGHSDIEQSIGLNQYMIRLYNLQAEGIEEVLFSPIVLIDPQKAPEELETGAGAVWGINPGGDAKRLPPVTTTPDLAAQMQRTLDFIRMNTGFSPAEFGESPTTSIGTGKQITSLRMPMNEQIEFKLGLMGSGLVKMNELCMKIDEIEWGNEEKIVYGKDNKSTPFSLKYMPNADINGWYRNEIYYSPFGADLPTRMMLLMQLQGQKIISKSFVRENTRGIDDPQLEEEKIFEETRKELQLQQELQMGAQMGPQMAQGGAQMAPGQAEKTQYAMERGAVTGKEAPSPSPAASQGMPTAPPGMGGPMPVPPGREGLTPMPPEMASETATLEPAVMPEEGEGQFILDVVRADLSDLQKLKGEVYIIGELVETGVSDTVELALTSLVDKKTILDQLSEKYTGRVQFTKVKEKPEGAVEVS